MQRANLYLLGVPEENLQKIMLDNFPQLLKTKILKFKNH